MFHPTFPVRNDCFDLGLLEHDFGNPDRVGIAGAPPGEVAGVFREPSDYFSSKPVGRFIEV